MRSRWKAERGILTLEACITLPIFIFVMLFLYSFFIVFEARNELAHVLLTTADSMALDAYSNEKKLGSGGLAEGLFMVLNWADDSTGTASDFVTNEAWHKVTSYEGSSGDGPNVWDGSIYASDAYAKENGETLDGTPQYAVSSELTSAIKQVFLAYLADGDLQKADALLKKHYRIRNGVEGLDFSKSYIASGVLHLSVSYTLEYEFNFFGLGEKTFEQKCASKLWK